MEAMCALRLAPAVDAALAAGEPVVALESTLIAHGLPPARRLETANAIEAEVRANGAVPATIAIIDGEMLVGLDQAQLTRIAEEPVTKASLRDLAIAVGIGGVWATTVASTMAVAARAGIRVFATGGIGGVHRDAASSFDESADLAALARLPVAVVSAGAKAVLDLPRTMERLETLGVPVLGYMCDELPAFYHHASGVPLRHRFDDVASIADVLRARFDTLGEGGVLIVQPPPADRAQTPSVIDARIADALAKAKANGIRGAAVTPYLLAELDAATDGDVVDTNVALVLENAELAALVAVAYARRANGHSRPPT